jgi:hypothetical protein
LNLLSSAQNPCSEKGYSLRGAAQLLLDPTICKKITEKLIMTNIDLTHHTAIANGIQLHYVKAGNAQQGIILLHGSPKTWYEWRLIISTLAENFTVITPDLRGFGDSDKPESGKPNRWN